MTIPEPPESTDVVRVKVEAEAPWLHNLVIENHFGIFQSPFVFYATNAFLSSVSGTLDATIPCTLDPDTS